MGLSKWNDNRILIENLRKTIESGSMSHALIIESDSFTDKLAFAKDLVKAMVCQEKTGEGCDVCINCRKVDDENYEDLLIINEGNDTIKIANVEEIQSFLKRKASLDKGNFVILCNADNLNVQSQNKLLKTLEEPAPGSTIILLSENVENFLDTVKSRSVIYRITGKDRACNEDTLEVAMAVVKALQEDGYFHEVKKMLDKKIKEKETVANLLDGMEKIYRDFLFDNTSEGRMYRKEEIFGYIRLIEEAKKDLRYGVSPAGALKNLVLKIGG